MSTAATKPRNTTKTAETVETPKVKIPHAKPEGLVRVKAGEYAIEKGDVLYTIEQRAGGLWHASTKNDETGKSVELDPQSSRCAAYEAVMAL
ncbi:MAG TPA: hypothetical protein VNX67_05285 [Solirubrobacteraceae bacterium]|jgi:hypothetical protein|nr:hypothetical protein [Solirubrobacteraceae bacterium]